MAKKEENFLENNFFLFESYGCEYEKSIKESSRGGQRTVKIELSANNNKPLKFAYASNGKGLVRVGKRGKIESDNLLGKLMPIQYGDTDKLLDFFSENGFIFNIEPEMTESIEVDTLFAIIARIKATVELLNQVGELDPKRKNYSKMLELVMYLTFSPSVSIQNHSYISAKHSIVSAIEQTDQSQDIDREQEMFDTGKFTVDDTIYGSYDFDANTYKAIINSLENNPGWDDIFFKQVVHFYANKPNVDTNLRTIVDFLFHYEMNVGIMRNFKSLGALDYYSPISTDSFSAELKHALVDVAKIVIGEEINANIKNVHPKYDISKMTPNWSVDSLMSALYFSIFYMNPEQELYKKCANPNCDNYFFVKTTATNKKYCSQLCSNAVQQAKLRKRKKEKAL